MDSSLNHQGCLNAVYWRQTVAIDSVVETKRKIGRLNVEEKYYKNLSGVRGWNRNHRPEDHSLAS